MQIWKNHFIYQFDYQHWANEVLFATLDKLGDDARQRDEGLFFHSITHTLNHMLVVDQIWFGRLQGECPTTPLNAVLHTEWRALKDALRHEMQIVGHWLQDQPEDFFADSVAYTNGIGKEFEDWTHDILSHMLTHQAHHRGQISAIAPRLGAAVPEMDFIQYRREMQGHTDLPKKLHG